MAPAIDLDYLEGGWVDLGRVGDTGKPLTRHLGHAQWTKGVCLQSALVEHALVDGQFDSVGI
jgi:hypothetical protein